MKASEYCIHGHFYQPPREDPLTGFIPYEMGAAPYRNWNERIHAECYKPNTELRNFEQISFNIGPTLCEWMESFDPSTFHKIVEQDRLNVLRHGTGNAIAQAYNHTILPLASYRDKVTQIAWGIADFQHHFRRKPQGMWLPETAVDMETLQIMAEQGIEFTILAPWQAQEADPDCTQPYLTPLSDGKQIITFFYQKDLSSRISFDAGATVNADSFAENILQSYFSPEKAERGEAQLILVASDGELYGHHQHLRDYFLARLVDGASKPLGISPTYPALWLKEHPVRRRMGIRESTSWSCHHGVARWMSNCPCTPGDATWKTRLRLAFERLAGFLDGIYFEETRSFVRDPWTLRNRYIHVMLGEMTMSEFLLENVGRSITSEQAQRLHLLLESQREQQRMFTSCGWFFDDFGRIEPRNNVAYAAQATWLARKATGINLEPYVLSDLQQVISALTTQRADEVFQQYLRRAEEIQGPYAEPLSSFSTN